MFWPKWQVWRERAAAIGEVCVCVCLCDYSCCCAIDWIIVMVQTFVDIAINLPLASVVVFLSMERAHNDHTPSCFPQVILKLSKNLYCV